MDNNDNDKSREPGSAVDATSSSPSPSPSPPGTYQSATPLFPPLNSPITTTATMLKRERDDRNVTCVSDVQAHLRVSRYVTHYFHLLACQDLCTHGASLRDMFVDEETKFTNRLQQVQEWLDELYATINTTNDLQSPPQVVDGAVDSSGDGVATVTSDNMPLHDQLVAVNEVVRQCMVRTSEVSAHLRHIRTRLALCSQEDEARLGREVAGLEDRLRQLKDREEANRLRYEQIVDQLHDNREKDDSTGVGDDGGDGGARINTGASAFFDNINDNAPVRDLDPQPQPPDPPKSKPSVPKLSGAASLQLSEKLVKKTRNIRRMLRHLRRKRKLLAEWFARKRSMLMDVVWYESSHPICPAIAALSDPVEHSRTPQYKPNVPEDSTQNCVCVDHMPASTAVYYPPIQDGITQELLRETYHQQKLLDLRVELEQGNNNRANCFLGLLVLDSRAVCLSLRDQWEFVGQQKNVFDSVLRTSFEKATLVSACADCEHDVLPTTSSEASVGVDVGGGDSPPSPPSASASASAGQPSLPRSCTIESLVKSHMKCARQYDSVADYLHSVACQVPHFSSYQIKALDPSLQALFHHANDLASFTLYLLPFIESHPAYSMMTPSDHQGLIRVLAAYLPPLFASEWSLFRLYHFHCQARVLQSCRSLLSDHSDKLKDMLEVGKLVIPHTMNQVLPDVLEHSMEHSGTNEEQFLLRYTTPLAALRSNKSPVGLHPAELPAPSASFTWDACVKAELTFLEKALWGDLLHVEGVLRESYAKVIERISGLRARVMGRVVKVLDAIADATSSNPDVNVNISDDSDPVMKAICDTITAGGDEDDDQLKGLAGCDPRTAKKAQIAQQVVSRLVTSCQHVSYALFLFEQELSALVPPSFWGIHLLTWDDVANKNSTCPVCSHVSSLEDTAAAMQNNSAVDGIALSVGMNLETATTSVTDQHTSVADQHSPVTDQHTSVADQQTSAADQHTSVTDQQVPIPASVPRLPGNINSRGLDITSPLGAIQGDPSAIKAVSNIKTDSDDDDDNTNNDSSSPQYNNVRNEMMRLFFGVWGDRGRAFEHKGRLPDDDDRADGDDARTDDMLTESEQDWEDDLKTEHVSLMKSLLTKYRPIETIDIIRLRVRTGSLCGFEVEDDVVVLGDTDGLPLSAHKYLDHLSEDDSRHPELCVELQAEELRLKLSQQAAKQKQCMNLYSGELNNVIASLQLLKERRMTYKTEYDSIELMMLLLHKRVLESQIRACSDWISDWEREPTTCLVSPTAQLDAEHRRFYRDLKALEHLIDFLTDEKLKLDNFLKTCTDPRIKSHIQLQIAVMVHDEALLEAAEWDVSNKLHHAAALTSQNNGKHIHGDAVDDVVVDSLSLFNLSQSESDTVDDNDPIESLDPPPKIQPLLTGDEPLLSRKARRRKPKGDRSGRASGTYVSEHKQQRLLAVLEERKKAKLTQDVEPERPRRTAVKPDVLEFSKDKPDVLELSKDKPEDLELSKDTPQTSEVKPDVLDDSAKIKSEILEHSKSKVSPPQPKRDVQSKTDKVKFNNKPKSRQGQGHPESEPLMMNNKQDLAVEPKPTSEKTKIKKNKPESVVKTKNVEQATGSVLVLNLTEEQLYEAERLLNDDDCIYPRARMETFTEDQVSKDQVSKDQVSKDQVSKDQVSKIEQPTKEPETKKVQEVIAVEPVASPKPKSIKKKPKPKPKDEPDQRSTEIKVVTNTVQLDAVQYVDDYELEIKRQQELLVIQKEEEKRKRKAEKAKKKKDKVKTSDSIAEVSEPEAPQGHRGYSVYVSETPKPPVSRGLSASAPTFIPPASMMTDSMMPVVMTKSAPPMAPSPAPAHVAPSNNKADPMLLQLLSSAFGSDLDVTARTVSDVIGSVFDDDE